MDSREILKTLLETTQKDFVECARKQGISPETSKSGDDSLIKLLGSGPDFLVDKIVELAGNYVRKTITEAVASSMAKRMGEVGFGEILKNHDGPEQ